MVEIEQWGKSWSAGLSVDEALAEMTMVAEGVRAARMFITRADDEGINVPFTRAINTLLDGDIDAEECCRRIVGLN